MDPDHPAHTFRVVFVQLVGSFLPVLNPVLQRVDQALHEGAGAGREREAGSVGERWRCTVHPNPGPADIQHLLHQGKAEPSQLVSPMPQAHLLGELPELGLNAAVPHAHAGQCGADVPGSTCVEVGGVKWCC